MRRIVGFEGFMMNTCQFNFVKTVINIEECTVFWGWLCSHLNILMILLYIRGESAFIKGIGSTVILILKRFKFFYQPDTYVISFQNESLGLNNNTPDSGLVRKEKQ